MLQARCVLLSGVEHLDRRGQPALVWSSERGRITCYGSPLIEGSSPTLKKAGKHTEMGTEGRAEDLPKFPQGVTSTSQSWHGPSQVFLTPHLPSPPLSVLCGLSPDNLAFCSLSFSHVWSVSSFMLCLEDTEINQTRSPFSRSLRLAGKIKDAKMKRRKGPGRHLHTPGSRDGSNVCFLSHKPSFLKSWMLSGTGTFIGYPQQVIHMGQE